MNAQIISIGNELTLGQTVDTNAAWLAQQLATLGISCTKHVTIADELPPIREAIVTASKEADLLLITGGLGPTPDDLTRDALAEAMNCSLRFHEESFRQIEAYFAERKRRMHEANRVQAMIPERAAPIINTCGTAPGIFAHFNKSDIYVMPGVPSEMKTMFERDVQPRLSTHGGGATILQGTLRSFGMSESEVGARIADLMRRDRNPTVGTSASEMIITIRINAYAASREEAECLLKADTADIRARLGSVVFGEGDDTLSSAVGQMLIERGETISTAESCTGGLIAKRLTDLSGSSAYMKQGFVVYANEAKRDLLGIPMELIQSHGAVSLEVAEAMAANCRRISDTTYALSVTGIAGPTGGTPSKPIGLVYLGLATPTDVAVKELLLGENLTRDQVRDRTAKAAMNMLRLQLMNE